MTRRRTVADGAPIGRSMARWIVVAFAVAGTSTAADAQTLKARGFFDAGAIALAAAESFEAITGTSTGVVFGGGGEVILPLGIFATVRGSQFRKTGERVFVFEGETFPLGIDTTIRIRPLEVSGGYRFERGNR